MGSLLRALLPQKRCYAFNVRKFAGDANCAVSSVARAVCQQVLPGPAAAAQAASAASHKNRKAAKDLITKAVTDALHLIGMLKEVLQHLGGMPCMAQMYYIHSINRAKESGLNYAQLFSPSYIYPTRFLSPFFPLVSRLCHGEGRRFLCVGQD